MCSTQCMPRTNRMDTSAQPMASSTTRNTVHTSSAGSVTAKRVGDTPKRDAMRYATDAAIRQGISPA